ncbi:MAG: hypothetical protein ALECFALPRED_010465 [Alectoria fallacina]|uniref:Uncharacterized protein n=1 Tax=Alectoria fallacina TaxID=1903189 RepID=A0A8H3F5G5_9LECA|nr:MAG: hypothetical protein ALECFALPRED_010465 [Alectoria fallacina]
MSLPSSPRQSSFAPSSRSSKTSPNPPKKRSNFFSGLFSVKEPSSQALHDYQRQLMKQGGGRVTAVGMPGVSSAKLPATVPKVNSKWDGVPHTLKEKQHDAARQSMSEWSRQLGTSRSGGFEHRPTSSADSSRKRLSRGTMSGLSMQSGSSNNLAELYGWESNSNHSASCVIDFAAEHRPTTSRSTSSWSAPPLQQSSVFTPHDPPRPPVTPLPLTELSPPSRFGSPNPPALSYSPMLTPYDSSPATPDVPLPFMSLASPKSGSSPQENAETALLDLPVSAEEVIVKSAGVNILGPPAAAKRKPRPTPLLPSDQRPNTSGAEFQSSSIHRREAPSQSTPSPRPALASYFPNTGSPANMPVRQNSTRERLGLGMNLKNQFAPPWRSSEHATDDVNVEAERIITPTPEGGQSLRRKSRMALFKK